MALLGWVPGTESQLADPAQPRFIHNTSGRFESRWATVQVQQDSPAIMLKVRPPLLLPLLLASLQWFAKMPSCILLLKVYLLLP